MRWSMLVLLGALAGCGVLSGEKSGDEDEDEDDSVDAGPLALALVWDSSASMGEEAGALARALPALDTARGDREVRLVVTTTTIDPSSGPTSGIDPGEAGTPLGGVHTSTEPDWVTGLTREVLCEAVPWQAAEVPSSSDYDCDPDAPAPPDVVSQEYLDCLCGFAEWEDSPQGSGNEEPLEAALMLGCRAAGEPPETCRDPLSPFASTADRTITDWPGEDVDAVHVLIVSDEGDNSRRMAQGDPDPTAYVEAFAALPTPPTVSSIGLTLDPEGVINCNTSGTPTWAVERVEAAAEATGGLTWPLLVPDGSDDCRPEDLAPALEEWVATR